MDTKERILQTALELYNKEGINTITSRHVAAKLDMSPGNLHYHFKHTEDIIQALYDRLVLGFDGIMQGIALTRAVDLDSIRTFVEQSFALTYKYRFIFLHFVEIGLRIPAIRASYYAITQRREKEFLSFFEQFGLLRDDIPERVLQSLVTQIFIVADFWLSNNELTLRLKGARALKHYEEVFFYMFYPYLTEEGRKGILCV